MRLSKNSLVNMMDLGLLLFSLSNCAVRPIPEQIASADYGPYPENYQEVIKNYYSKVLFDPHGVYTYENPTRAWDSLGGLIFGGRFVENLTVKTGPASMLVLDHSMY